MWRVIVCMVCIVISLNHYHPQVTFAKASVVQEEVKQSIITVDNTIKSLHNSDFAKANMNFGQLKAQWLQIKGDIKKDSLSAYGKIETKIASASVALLNQDSEKAKESLEFLKNYFVQYRDGQLSTEKTSPTQTTISTYLTLLKETKESFTNGDLVKGKIQVEQLKSQWLAVEGNVVGQSQTAYNNSERSLVLLTSYSSDASTLPKAAKLIEQMIEDLTPLAQSSYGIWDAAFIPIREGLEALLVVGALLAITKKETGRKGNYLVVGGTIAGILVSLGIGILVNSVLSSASFGNNNFIINGWSGIIASVMLLYVSHWLHRKANIQHWNTFMNKKTAEALSKGKVFSLALLAFLAVLREGIETVIFLIGMANQMTWSQLLTGILVGFGILMIIGIAILQLSIRLPLKPFFFVSSLIVFYLCIKFMGSGIHSLQLSGLISSTASEWIPTIQAIGVYPSWYSTLPQIIIVIFSISIILFQKKKSKERKVNREAI